MWQATHGWPQLELAADIRDEYSGVGPRLEFVGLLLVQFSPVAAALWIYGLVRLLRVPALVRAKPLAWAFLVLVVVFLVTGGKAYYVVGAVPVLLAAGACGLEERWSRRGLVVAGAVLALSAFVAWPAALPVLPERAFGASVYPELNDDQAEMIGWPALVDAVGPRRRRQRCRRSSSPRTTARPARSSGTGPTCRCSAGTTGTRRGGRRPRT